MSLQRRLTQSQPVALAGLDVSAEPFFDFSSDEYSSFHARSGATAFQAPGWLDKLHRQVAPALEAEPITITVRDAQTGELRLVIPLVSRRLGRLTTLEFCDFGLCDYNALVYCADDVKCLIADRSLRARVHALLPPTDTISLIKLRGDEQLLEFLFPRAHRAPMRVSSHAITTGGGWDDWRSARLDPSLRRELDLKRRRIAKAGVPAFRLVQERDEIARVFSALRTFRAHRFAQRGIADVIDNEAVFSFYRQVALDGARDGTARTFCLYVAGEPVAVMFGTVHRRRFSLLLVGFDLERYRRLSVGLLAIEDTIRASFESGDEAYDFTIGDYPFKLQFGARSSPLFEWHVPRGTRGYLAVVQAAAFREMKRHMKPLVTGVQRFWTVALRHRLKSKSNQKAGSPAVTAIKGSGRNGLEIAGHTIAILALGKDAEPPHVPPGSHSVNSHESAGSRPQPGSSSWNEVKIKVR
jgi:CelD/BcsL family acetyltransferase involved in cellulose biosynthesis